MLTGGLAAAVVLGVASPAIANDFSSATRNIGSITCKVGSTTHQYQVYARGSWDDSIDTLSITISGNGCPQQYTGTVKIEPVDGSGPSFPISRSTNGTSRTPNLSIPEDENYRMRIEGDSVGTFFS